MTTTDINILNTDDDWGEIATLVPSQVLQQIQGKQIKKFKKNKGWGNNITEEKQKNRFRIYFQNINGLCKKSDWKEVEYKMGVMKKMKVDLFGFVETNVAWTPQTRSRVQQIGRNVLGDRRFEMSSSDEPSVNTYQPGGAMIGAVGKTTGRVLHTDSDPHGLGRWSSVCLTGKGVKLYVVVAYRVTQESNDGINTAYIQQYRLMRSKGVENPRPRKQWCTDLLVEIKKWRKDGDVLLLTDANATMNDKEFGRFIAEAGLFDILGYMHGVGGVNSHVNGTNRITFAFGTYRITKAAAESGMLPFNDILTSDHRAIYVEFNALHLFRGEINAIHPPMTRKVTSKHPKIAKIYREKVTDKIRMCGLVKKIDDHLDVVLKNEEEDSDVKMQKLDKTLHTIMIETEAELPVIPPYWWSEPLHKAYQIVNYWQAALSFWNNNIDGTDQLKEKELEIGVDIDLTYGCKERSVRGFLRRAQKELRKIRNNSEKIREEWQEKKAEEEEKLDPKSTKATILKTMRYKEAAARMWAIMKRYLHPDEASQLTHLLVPDKEQWTTNTQKSVAHYMEKNKPKEATACLVIHQMLQNYKLGLEKYLPHKRVVMKDEMDEHLLDFHKRHFRQAEETPFAQSMLQNKLGYCGDTDFADQLRDGTAEIDGLDVSQYTKDFLHEMKRTPQDPPAIPGHLKMADVMKGFKLWNEKTSTSPLGNHLGLYKTWFKTAKQQEEWQEEELDTVDFFGMITKLLRMALHLMAPPEKWKIVHNMFLLKEKGNYKVSRMRTIHKIDAELNMLRRDFIAHKTMQNAERYDHFDDAQYGGRQGRTATDPVMIKVLALETAHFQRSNMGITDCDAKACYDRILPSISSVLESKAGAPKEVSILLAKILQQMEYYPATAKGVGKVCNKHDEESSVQGSGQGAADSPAKWTIVDNAVIKLFRKWAIGRMIQDTMKRIKEKRDNVMFVDDQTLLHQLMLMFAASCFIIMGIIQYDVTLWGRYLWESGGWLEYSKTTYCALIWAFKPYGKPYLLPEEKLPPNNVYITGADGSTTLLKRVDVNTATKMLGVRHAATLQQDTEFRHLLGKTVKFSCAIVACPLRDHQVRTCYFAVYIASVSYALPTTSLTTSQCTKLHKALITRLLPRLGYQHSFPQSIAFGPTYYGGIGLLTIDGEQAVAKIANVIMHVRADTSVGREFLIALSWAQVQTGVGTPLLEDTRPIPHMEGRYIRHLRKCLHTMQAKIFLKYQIPLLLEQEYDTFLMDEFLDSDHVAAEVQEELNCCRLFLQVTTVAHIVSSDGKRIKPEYFHPHEIPRKSPQIIEVGLWPRQERPYLTTWKKWKEALEKTICNSDGVLKQPLGKWLRQDDRWSAYYDGTFMYRRIQKKWSKHRVITSTRNKNTYARKPIAVINSPKGEPITDLRIEKDVFISTPTLGYTDRPTEVPRPATTWNEYVRGLPLWERRLLKKVQEIDTGYATLKTLLQLEEQLWLVTDGGLEEGIGYFGWVVASDRQILWENRGHAQGDKALIETLRTEGISLLSILVFFKRYTQFFEVKFNPSQIIHFCDNMGVVRRVKWSEIRSVITPGECLKADADIILQIEHIYSEIGVSFATHHVKGHQDKPAVVQKLLQKLDKREQLRGPKNRTLTWEARLNIRADELATQARSEISPQEMKEPVDKYPDCAAHLVIGETLITRKVKREIRKAWNTIALQKELRRRFKWNKSIFGTIDWDTFGKLIEKKTYSVHKFLIKFVNRRLPVRGEKYVAMKDKTCPCCGATKETNRHFLSCSKILEDWKGLLEELTVIYKKNYVDPALRIILNTAIKQQNISELQGRYSDMDWKPYDSLIRQQSKIGWYQVFYGRFGLQWKIMQKTYCSNQELITGENQYDDVWLSRIINTIWKFAHLRWKARNAWLHDNDNSDYSVNRQILLARIRTLYGKELDLLEQDRKIFTRSLEVWETSSVTDMRRWINANQPYITECLKLRLIQEKKNSSDIRQYYEGCKSAHDARKKQGKKHKSKEKRQKNQKDERNNKKYKQKDIRRELLGWDNEMCTDAEAESRNITRGLTTYFKEQDKPPDNNSSFSQMCVTDYFGLNPQT